MKRVTIALALIALGLTVMAQNPHCNAKKRNGDSCRSTFLLPSGMCRAHDTVSVTRCGAPAGKDRHPCRMPVSKPGERCKFHPDGKVIIIKKIRDERGLISVVMWEGGQQYAQDYMTRREYRRL